MTHEELLAKINSKLQYCTCEGSGWGGSNCYYEENQIIHVLRAVVELHSPFDGYCQRCTVNNWGELRQEYPCDEIQAIEKELSQ